MGIFNSFTPETQAVVTVVVILGALVLVAALCIFLLRDQAKKRQEYHRSATTAGEVTEH